MADLLPASPENRFIVFHGDQHEAQTVKLSGVVRLTTPDAMSIKNVKIWLEGKRRISYVPLAVRRLEAQY